MSGHFDLMALTTTEMPRSVSTLDADSQPYTCNSRLRTRSNPLCLFATGKKADLNTTQMGAYLSLSDVVASRQADSTREMLQAKHFGETSNVGENRQAAPCETPLGGSSAPNGRHLYAIAKRSAPKYIGSRALWTLVYQA